MQGLIMDKFRCAQVREIQSEYTGILSIGARAARRDVSDTPVPYRLATAVLVLHIHQQFHDELSHARSEHFDAFVTVCMTHPFSQVIDTLHSGPDWVSQV